MTSVQENYEPVDPKPVLEDDRLYCGDNGRCFCGLHAGASARYTGFDVSGQRVWAISDQDREEWRRELGRGPSCETCRAIRRARGA